VGARRRDHPLKKRLRPSDQRRRDALPAVSPQRPVLVAAAARAAVQPWWLARIRRRSRGSSSTAGMLRSAGIAPVARRSARPAWEGERPLASAVPTRRGALISPASGPSGLWASAWPCRRAPPAGHRRVVAAGAARSAVGCTPGEYRWRGWPRRQFRSFAFKLRPVQLLNGTAAALPRTARACGCGSLVPKGRRLAERHPATRPSCGGWPWALIGTQAIVQQQCRPPDQLEACLARAASACRATGFSGNLVVVIGENGPGSGAALGLRGAVALRPATGWGR